MSRHDYSQSTVTSVSDAIISCKNNVENTVLSVESMPYSWDTGIINNVVTWFEVLQIIDSKEQIRSVFEKADSKFGGTVQDIGRADSSAVRRLESGLDSLRAFQEKMSVVEEYSVQFVAAVNVFGSLHSLLSSIDEEYNNVDFDKLTEEERKDYYERLIAKENLSEDDRRKIQDYLDYLQGKYTIDDKITEEEQMFIALYEKLHEDEAEAMKTFFDNCSDLEGSFSEEEKNEIKFLIYTSDDPSHTIIIDNISQVKVADFNAKRKDGTDGCWYSTDDKKIHINRCGKSSFRETDFGPYHSLFEEIAHCIDDYMCSGFETQDHEFNYNNYFSSNYEYKEKLESAMEHDVKYNVDKVLTEIVNEIYESGDFVYKLSVNRDKIINVLTHCIKEKGTKFDTLKETFRLNFFELATIKDIIENNHLYNTACDVYGAILGTNWGHDWHNDYPKEYNYTEFFSEYIANAVTNPEEDKIARELLPETYKVMDAMMKERTVKSQVKHTTIRQKVYRKSSPQNVQVNG